MSNMNVILSANLQVQDITGGGSQQIINRNIGNPTYAATTVFYDPFFQATTSGVEVPLPVDAYVAYVKNLDPAAVITSPIRTSARRRTIRSRSVRAASG